MFLPLSLLFFACEDSPETSSPETSDTDVSPTTSARDPRFDSAAEVLLRELGPNLAEGVSIALVERGRFAWVEGFGTADPSGAVPVTPETIFAIGSTTKQMTAALVLQAAQRGALSLDAPLDLALPDLDLAADPSWVRDATLHDLLSHQGGLVDYVDWLAPSDDPDLAGWVYGFLGPNLWPMSSPGAFFNYSNPNFVLAGLALEATDESGRYYPDILSEDLFAPLGMSRSFIRKAEVTQAGDFALSTGVDATSEDVALIPMSEVPDPASVRPAGLVWSTPSDMCRWGSFVLHGDPEILDDALREKITSPQVGMWWQGEALHYGYGEFLWDLYPLSDGYYPLRVWEHGGNTLSFTSVLVILPDQDVVFSILSNGVGDSWTEATEAVIRAVVDPMPEVSDYAPIVDLTDIGSHVGSYVDPYNVGEIFIAEDGEGLQISIPLLDRYGYSLDPKLIPRATDVWYASIDGELYDLTFIRDPEGGQDLWLSNRGFVGQRAEPNAARRAALPPSREAVARALDAARLR